MYCCLTFSLLKHLFHIGSFPLQCLNMLSLLVLKLAQLGGERGGLMCGHKVKRQIFLEEFFGNIRGKTFVKEKLYLAFSS